ncbi:MAG: MaoC family dehydratase [Candidatus Paceibacterota bacterium]
MEIPDLSVKDIEVGDTITFEHAFTEKDVETFARLSGDQNPLHLDEEYAQKTEFGRRLVQGMLVGSLCSRLVGMHIPGKRCLYLGQTLLFKKPVFIGETLKVIGTVTSRSHSTRIVKIDISISKGQEIAATGEATTRVLA